MVISGRLLSAGDRSTSSRAKPSSDFELLPEHIHDELQLPCIPPERPDLRDLNNSLEALAAVFPNIQIEVFREILLHFDGESRLALVADALLKNRAEWVKGRWNVPVTGTEISQSTSHATLPKSEAFRSQDYKKAVTSLAWSEFKGLPKSTVNGVLAECNYSYLDARQTLLKLSSKSWRFTISSLLLRRKPIATGEAENHPLVIWRSSGQGSIIPTIRATGSSELDRELFNTLIKPLQQAEKENRVAKDRNLAIILNQEEAENASATLECTCCFLDGAFEQFTQCNREGHMICFRCVQASIKEALFGQGWQSSINADTGTLRCIAVDGSGCEGHVAYEHIRRAVMEDRKGAGILHKLDQRLAEHDLVASHLPLVRCPFCEYAEVDDIYVPDGQATLRLRTDSVCDRVLLAVGLAIVILSTPAFVVLSILCLLLTSQRTLGLTLSSQWQAALNRHRRRRRGLKFDCQNPSCRRASCLTCEKPWVDIHVCNESSLVALRTQIEQAMSMAIKRVCPRCNTSFVKNAGCNKLTCPCGYKMCYVCRTDLGNEGYRHFCDHFRPDGDPRPCTECDRCNLWESEDTDVVLRQAGEEAERKWKEMEKRDLSDTERSFLKTGVASRSTGRTSATRTLLKGSMPSFAEALDLVVESIFV